MLSHALRLQATMQQWDTAPDLKADVVTIQQILVSWKALRLQKEWQPRIDFALAHVLARVSEILASERRNLD